MTTRLDLRNYLWTLQTNKVWPVWLRRVPQDRIQHNSTSLLNDHLRPPYQIRLGECISERGGCLLVMQMGDILSLHFVAHAQTSIARSLETSKPCQETRCTAPSIYIYNNNIYIYLQTYFLMILLLCIHFFWYIMDFVTKLSIPQIWGGSEFGTSHGSLLRSLMWRQASCCSRTAQCQINDVIWEWHKRCCILAEGNMLTPLSIRRCICIKWQWHRHMLREWQCLRFWTSHALRSDWCYDQAATLRDQWKSCASPGETLLEKSWR